MWGAPSGSPQLIVTQTRARIRPFPKCFSRVVLYAAAGSVTPSPRRPPAGARCQPQRTTGRPAPLLPAPPPPRRLVSTGHRRPGAGEEGEASVRRLLCPSAGGQELRIPTRPRGAPGKIQSAPSPPSPSPFPRSSQTEDAVFSSSGSGGGFFLVRPSHPGLSFFRALTG